jgi:hypothetical protein
MVGTAARLAKQIGRGRARLSVSVSSYVPKAHTAFQLEPFAGEETLTRRQRLLRAALPRNVLVSFHDVAASLVEATLARGGPGSDALVEEAWRLGARFDGWSEHFSFAVWQKAAAAVGIALGESRFDDGAEVPWEEAVDPGVERCFLDEELLKARRGALTEDCRAGVCGACGVCGGGVEMEVLG